MRRRKFDYVIINAAFLIALILVGLLVFIKQAKEIDRLKSVPIYEKSIKDQEVTNVIYSILVRRIVTLETAMVLEPEDRHQWVITDLNNQLVACQEGPFLGIESEVIIHE
jgi:hypothetical protein